MANNKTFVEKESHAASFIQRILKILSRLEASLKKG